MTKTRALEARNAIYKKLPAYLNQLGFEMYLLVNFKYKPSAESLKVFYKEYTKVRGK